MSSIHFKVIVPLYNVEQWVSNCIKSIKVQDHKNFQCIVVDDNSTDKSAEIIRELIADDDRFVFIENKERKLALRNTYEAINLSNPDDEDVIVIVDGDDWFATKSSLSRVETYYKERNALVTHGSYIEYPSMQKGTFSRDIPKEVINQNAFRRAPWMSSHLRTWKASLWMKIKKESLLDDDGNFFPMTGDMAVMFPLLEMAGDRIVHIPEVLYCYNRSNPLNDDRVNHALQMRIEGKIRNAQPYERLNLSEGKTTVRLKGGLGNQLFQIAAAKSLALSKGGDLTIDMNNVGAPSELSHNKPQFYLDNIFRNIKVEPKAAEAELYNESHYHFQELPKWDNICLHGYFQSEKYFKEHESEIRTMLKADQKTEEHLQSKYGEILSKDNTVSLHVRRGDYIGKEQFHPIIDKGYYEQAIEKHSGATFLVFSDDISWCKDNLPEGPEYVFVEGNKDYEDLYLMSKCAHNIIANSSFSWWGAWLNENKDKQVTAPSLWFGPALLPSHDLKDLLPDEWEVK